MKVISEKEFEKLNNTVVAIGKFDGLHKGHRTLINKMTQMKAEGLSSVLFSFKKAPNEVLGNSEAEYILTNEEKLRFLENIGVDYYIEYPCNEGVLSTRAEDFLEKIIIGRLGAKKIVCGTDFHFGYKRQGDTELLKKMQDKYGYELVVIDKLKYKNSDISSSRIRETVVAGDIEQVNLMLGYPYTIIGEVVEGNKLGRELGFPTANIKPDDRKILPPYGVYYTKVIVEGKEYKGITNIGKKPTVSGENSIGVETYLLDYSGDLYEKILEIRFYKYKRPERKFSDVEELKAQVVSDIKDCENSSY